MLANYLIASDLHLTLVKDDEDRATDGELIAFLAHYRDNPVDDRPWTLLLAGDSFDFLYPDMDLFTQRHPGDDAPRAGGAGFLEHWDMDAVAWRLRTTMIERAELFAELARFLLAGNRLVLIKGNHDVELQWARIQEAFADTLCEVASAALDEPDEGALRARVEFVDWFYLEQGQLYVEHGNQYDEFNAFPNVLDPALVHDPTRAFMPLGSRMTQYLTNAFVDYKPGPAHGSFMQYVVRNGHLLSRRFIGRSLQILSHALGNAGLFSEEGWRTGFGKEDHRLVHVAERTGVGVDALAAVQALQAKPATAIRGFFFNRMFLDRLFVIAFSLAMLGWALLFGALSPREPSLLAAAVATPIAGVLAALIRFRRRRWGLPLRFGLPGLVVAACAVAPLLLDGGTASGTFLVTFTALVACVSVAIMPLTEVLDLKDHLRQTARCIADLLDVRVVVFGHHHRPVELGLGEGRVYMNSGAWVNTGIEQRHAHVVLLRDADGALEASLHLGRDYLEG